VDQVATRTPRCRRAPDRLLVKGSRGSPATGSFVTVPNDQGADGVGATELFGELQLVPVTRTQRPSRGWTRFHAVESEWWARTRLGDATPATQTGSSAVAAAPTVHRKVGTRPRSRV
jgi:hypothetical protein